MNKIIVLVLLIVIVVAGGVFVSSRGSDNNAVNPVTVPIQESLDNKNTATENGVALNAVMVAGHASKDNCWVIIDNKVYDVTSFVPEHPGGAPIMLPYCGKDATAAFDTKGAVNKMHSINAEKMLSKYLVGSLVI